MSSEVTRAEWINNFSTNGYIDPEGVEYLFDRSCGSLTIDEKEKFIDKFPEMMATGKIETKVSISKETQTQLIRIFLIDS